jgi:hypothetical protein
MESASGARTMTRGQWIFIGWVIFKIVLDIGSVVYYLWRAGSRG